MSQLTLKYLKKNRNFFLKEFKKLTKYYSNDGVEITVEAESSEWDSDINFRFKIPSLEADLLFYITLSDVSKSSTQYDLIMYHEYISCDTKKLFSIDAANPKEIVKAVENFLPLLSDYYSKVKTYIVKCDNQLVTGYHLAKLN